MDILETVPKNARKIKYYGIFFEVLNSKFSPQIDKTGLKTNTAKKKELILWHQLKLLLLLIILSAETHLISALSSSTLAEISRLEISIFIMQIKI